MTRRNLKSIPQQAFAAHIESLAHDSRGVAHINGKATFIEGALPGEDVMFVYTTQRKRFDEGQMTEVVHPSPERVTPRCPHFGVCGGCSLQHLSSAGQVRAKQAILLENLQHIGRVEPQEILPPLTGPAWAYRRKARLGAKYVQKKAAMLVGFRERRSGFLAELTRCDVLHAAVGEKMMALRELLLGLQAYQHIPQIELAAGDEAVALVFRHLAPLVSADVQALHRFGEQHGLQIYLQAAGPDSVIPLNSDQPRLSYRLPEYAVELFFLPTDFTQVNAAINQAMVHRALDLLALSPHDRVLDLFCGLGNFTLPMARHAGQVLGIEGDAGLIQRAQANARHNEINNAEFYVADLHQETMSWPWARGQFNKILLDPPRTGALEVVNRIGEFKAEKIIYVSCNSATLARDAEVLVHRHGYRLTQAGIMDMFPHTNHVEAMAVFEP